MITPTARRSERHGGGPRRIAKSPLRCVTCGLVLRFGTIWEAWSRMAAVTSSLLHAFAQIDDPRKPRGVRHPFTSMLALTFVGLLCRQTDFASLQRWATDHWRILKGALGFTRKKPPHATTISRAVSRFSLEQFRDAFARWLVSLPETHSATAASVDGKTSKQGRDAGGDPIHMLNIFAHDLGLSLGQFPVSDGKPTEPQALKA